MSPSSTFIDIYTFDSTITFESIFTIALIAARCVGTFTELNAIVVTPSFTDSALVDIDATSRITLISRITNAFIAETL